MPLAPEIEAMLAAAAEAAAPALSTMSPSQGRAMYQLMRPAMPDLTVGKVRNLSIDGPASKLPIRVYTPESSGPHPVLLNFHGGGWVIGDLETADGVCRDFCRSAACVVVSLDYRLAPEHPYPAAAQDCFAATQWVAANMASISGNGKLALTGESAGANLAAISALKARAAGGPDICLQLLAYPVIDHNFARASYLANGEDYLLTTDSMRWFWDLYCPDVGARNQPDACPIYAASLSDLPPAFVMTAEFDPLRDEGKAYADALRAAGVTTRYRCFDGLIHDFLATAPIFDCSRVAFDEACRALRQAFEAA